ncbi:hypothetical protein EON63_23340 [archaeon]|nr:MAG: hypothetical protein EON63_23340 [archaeon]
MTKLQGRFETVDNSTVALKVRSHIGRDLLQSSALFKHEWQVAWEYVSNGLQYVDANVSPVVTVNIDQSQKRMIIKDNGRGMNLSDLGNYFTMHGENIDTKAGRPGRGMFGTGKSAAFGIANFLRVTTVKDGKRSKVELHRVDIEAGHLHLLRIRLVLIHLLRSMVLHLSHAQQAPQVPRHIDQSLGIHASAYGVEQTLAVEDGVTPIELFAPYSSYTNGGVFLPTHDDSQLFEKSVVYSLGKHIFQARDDQDSHIEFHGKRVHWGVCVDVGWGMVLAMGVLGDDGVVLYGCVYVCELSWHMYIWCEWRHIPITITMCKYM